MWYVYVLKSDKDSSLYVGSAKNVKERIESHNQEHNRSTKNKTPWRVLRIEEYSVYSFAVRREKFFKSGDGRRVLRNLLKIPNK